jgi:hypothetical protein
MHALLVKGVNGVHKIEVLKSQGLKYDPETRAFRQAGEWYMDTDGSNPIEVLGLPWVDARSPQTHMLAKSIFRALLITNTIHALLAFAARTRTNHQMQTVDLFAFNFFDRGCYSKPTRSALSARPRHLDQNPHHPIPNMLFSSPRPPSGRATAFALLLLVVAAAVSGAAAAPASASRKPGPRRKPSTTNRSASSSLVVGAASPKPTCDPSYCKNGAKCSSFRV